MKIDNQRIFASCPKGLEYLLEAELEELGHSVKKVTPHGVFLDSDIKSLYEMCLWSRLANRIHWVLAEWVSAPHDKLTRDSLYDKAKAVNWLSYVNPGKNFWISAQGQSGDIRHSHFGAQVVKDAINDYFREQGAEAPVLDKESPATIVQVRFGRKSMLSLDVAGRSLHQRGYRLEGKSAPLKENLAAALLHRAGWPELLQANQSDEVVFLDPMCGSGTLVIEAAMMALDIAPGLLADEFIFRHAPWHDPELWGDVLSDAYAKAVRGKRRWHGALFGADINSRSIQAAKRNVSRAGLDRWVNFQRRDVVDDPVESDHKGVRLLLTNPPYGERLGETAILRELYRGFGQCIKESYAGWRVGVFSSVDLLVKQMGLRAEKRYKFYNGDISTTLYMFSVFSEERRRSAEGAFDNKSLSRDNPFANRLRKNFHKMSRWAGRNDIQAYRVYDADIPEYAVAVDCYGDWVHIQEYAPPKNIDPDKAQERLWRITDAVPDVLGVDKGCVFLKERRRQKGKEQYEKQALRREEKVIRERNSSIICNLSDYLDTGLFLDHRPTRLWIAENSNGKRFLNLFCYTAAASVHAAVGGAESTTSVDLSSTYLEWGQRNFAENNLKGRNHQFIRADVMTWLSEHREKYELIFMDPPTFSNSKKMQGILDIQRDHIRLINDAVKLLTDDGVLIFSNNFRRFKLASEIIDKYRVENRSRETIPEDFARNPRIHQCWWIYPNKG